MELRKLVGSISVLGILILVFLYYNGERIKHHSSNTKLPVNITSTNTALPAKTVLSAEETKPTEPEKITDCILGFNNLLENKIQEAEKEFLKARSKNPKNFVPDFGLSLIFYKRNDMDKATKEFNRGVEAYLQPGANFEDVAEEDKRALFGYCVERRNKEPDNRLIKQIIAMWFHRVNKTREAHDLLMELEKESPNDPQNYYIEGKLEELKSLEGYGLAESSVKDYEIMKRVKDYTKAIDLKARPEYLVARAINYQKICEHGRPSFKDTLKISDKYYRQAYRDFNRSGRFWEDVTTHKRLKNAKAIEKLTGLKKGDSIADIGCGVGYFLPYFAKEVGRTGKVYAVDVNPYALEFCEKIRKKTPYTNVAYVNNTFTDVCLPKESLDWAFMRGVPNFGKNHIQIKRKGKKLEIKEFPVKAADTGIKDSTGEYRTQKRGIETSSNFAASLHRALKPGGKLMILNAWKLDLNLSGENERRMRDRFVEEIEKTGYFKLEKEYQENNSPWFYWVFRKV